MLCSSGEVWLRAVAASVTERRVIGKLTYTDS